MLIQIFQQGRDAYTKQALYAAWAERLQMECGLRGKDLIVMVSGNGKEDLEVWGGEGAVFGGGFLIPTLR